MYINLLLQLLLQLLSLIIAAQNTLRTNNIKVKIDGTKENSKYSRCGHRDETII